MASNVEKEKAQGSPLQRVPSKHLGPEYRALDEKPAATVSKSVKQENVHILPQTPQLIALLTYVRQQPKMYHPRVLRDQCS